LFQEKQLLTVFVSPGCQQTEDTGACGLLAAVKEDVLKENVEKANVGIRFAAVQSFLAATNRLDLVEPNCVVSILGLPAVALLNLVDRVVVLRSFV
jgi:hypothetical protein